VEPESRSDPSAPCARQRFRSSNAPGRIVDLGRDCPLPLEVVRVRPAPDWPQDRGATRPSRGSIEPLIAVGCRVRHLRRVSTRSLSCEDGCSRVGGAALRSGPPIASLAESATSCSGAVSTILGEVAMAYYRPAAHPLRQAGGRLRVVSAVGRQTLSSSGGRVHRRMLSIRTVPRDGPCSRIRRWLSGPLGRKGSCRRAAICQ
jgi:hypothetical protein